MQLYEKLRQPEFEKRRNASSLKLLLEAGQVDVARPFPPWSLPLEPTWEESPYNDDTWGLYYHSLGWLIVLDFGIDQAATQVQRDSCRTRLRDLLFSYLAFLNATPESSCPKMMWFDHATAWRASAIAYLYERRFKNSLTEDEALLVDDAVRKHEAKLLEFIESGRWNANNHGIFHAEALWDLAQVFESISAETSRIAVAHMQNVFAGMIDLDEGVCREQSIYYHLLDAWLLSRNSTYMARFEVDVISGYKQVLGRMLQFYSDFSGGNSSLHAIGDTQYGRSYQNSMLADIIEAAGEYGAGRDRPKGDELVEYPANGYYFFSSRSGAPDSNNAILLSKPFLGAHGHTDGGSFTIDFSGKPFVVDSGGPYAYGKALRFNYFKAAEAHNVVLFGKKSQPYLTEITSVSRAKLGNAVRLRATELSDAVWQRTFVSLDGGVFLVVDRVVQPMARPFHVLVHIAPEVNVQAKAEGVFGLESGGLHADVLFVSNAKMKCAVRMGDGAFPRGMVTRELGATIPAPVLFAEISAKDAWVATIIGRQTSKGVGVHSLYSGKVLRVTIPGETSKVVECNLEDPGVAVKVYSYRAHR